MGNVYVRLYLKTPGFPLRAPKAFLEGLLKTYLADVADASTVRATPPPSCSICFTGEHLLDIVFSKNTILGFSSSFMSAVGISGPPEGFACTLPCGNTSCKLLLCHLIAVWALGNVDCSWQLHRLKTPPATAEGGGCQNYR